ncbi:MAG: hypothetical protein SGILL_005600, partial [Bacillariaceae sp.]
ISNATGSYSPNSTDWFAGAVGNATQLAQQVSSSCDQSCFNNVFQQMIEENLRSTAPGYQLAAFSSSSMVDITEQSSYNKNWVALDTAQSAAYQAISNALIPGDQDIRSQVFTYLASAKGWTDTLLSDAKTLAGQVVKTCDQTCFDSVKQQLIREFTYLKNLNDWITGYTAFNSAISNQITTYLASARAEISISSTQSVPSANPNGWLETMLNVVELVSGLNWAVTSPIQPLVTIAAYTAEFVIKEEMAGQKSTSTANINFQNDGLNAIYSELVDSVTTNYNGLNLVAGNQAEAICANYGKLENWFEIVYPHSAPVSSATIGQQIGITNDFHEYLAYEWLFPSKYQICTQVVDQEPNVNNGCLGDNVGPRWSKLLGYANGRRDTCYHGTCQQTTFNCPVYAYFWICDKSNAHYGPSGTVINTLNTNPYADAKGLVKNKRFGDTLYGDCINSFRGGTCKSAGMNFDVSKSGDCVLNGSDAYDTYSCDPFHY